MPSVQNDFFLSSCQACRSTLLRAIGQGLVVGFPKNLHALYVQQLEGTDGAMSVFDTVMQADKEVLAWRQHAALLQVRFTMHCTPEQLKSREGRISLMLTELTET